MLYSRSPVRTCLIRRDWITWLGVIVGSSTHAFSSMTFGLGGLGEIGNTVVGHEVNFLVDARALGLDVGRLLAFFAAF